MPGYFSGDELQWGHYGSGLLADLPWVPFSDYRVFQYRPLTFNLWLLISHFLFEHPRAFHALWALLGVGNAALLWKLLRAYGTRNSVAVPAALVFLSFPYAVYVHAWVATLADLLWVACGMLGAWLACANARHLGVMIPLLTALALLSKESAIVLPVVYLLLGWGCADQRRPLLIAATAAAVPVAFYLAVRLPYVLDTSITTTGYAIDVGRLPMNILAYHLFPFVPGPLEVNGAFERWSVPKLVAVALFVGTLLASALWRSTRPRWLWPFITGAAVGPAMLLDTLANQYGYAMAAVVCVLGAVGWQRSSRWARVPLVLLVVLVVSHGARIAREMHRVAEIQAEFSPSLAGALTQARTFPLRLALECEKDHWIYRRLTTAIPAWRDILIGDRVELVSAESSADWVAHCTGTVVRADDEKHRL